MGIFTLQRHGYGGRAGAKCPWRRKNVGMKRPHLDQQQRRLLLCSLVIAGGIVMVILGFMASVTGRKALALPTTIENIDPVRGAVRVPSQTEVFVDLLAGYTGVLVIDGIELVDRRSERSERPQCPGACGPRPTGDPAGDDDLRARKRHPHLRAVEGRQDQIVLTGLAHRHRHLLEDHRRFTAAIEHLHLDVLGLLRPAASSRQGLNPEGCRWPAARRTRRHRGSAHRAPEPW